MISDHDIWDKVFRVDQVKFFKSSLPNILLGPLANNLSHMYLEVFILTQSHFVQNRGIKSQQMPKYFYFTP